MPTSEVLGIVVTVLLAFLSVIGSLIAYIFKDLAKQVEKNTRNMDSLANSFWLINTKVTSVEDHLHDTDGYEPPKLIGRAETGT